MRDAFELDLTCPTCARPNDHLTEGFARDGSVSICWLCRQPAIFLDSPWGMCLRLPTLEEDRLIRESTRFVDLMAGLSTLDQMTINYDSPVEGS